MSSERFSSGELQAFQLNGKVEALTSGCGIDDEFMTVHILESGKGFKVDELSESFDCRDRPSIAPRDLSSLDLGDEACLMPTKK